MQFLIFFQSFHLLLVKTTRKCFFFCFSSLFTSERHTFTTHSCKKQWHIAIFIFFLMYFSFCNNFDPKISLDCLVLYFFLLNSFNIQSPQSVLFAFLLPIFVALWGFSYYFNSLGFILTISIFVLRISFSGCFHFVSS